MSLRGWAYHTTKAIWNEPLPVAFRKSYQNFFIGGWRRWIDFRDLLTPVWDLDWDVLLILDACRVDVMQEVSTEYTFLPPTLDSIWSVGSATPEWMDRTFDPDTYGEQMYRTAYLTGNPFSAKPRGRIEAAESDALPLDGDGFAHLDEVWRTDWVHDPVSTVPPRALTDRAIRYWRSATADQMIVHYMQPHLPFRARPEWFNRRRRLDKFGEPEKEEGKDCWLRARDGEVDREEFWTAYRDNLRWVLDDIRILINNCDGKIGISADHGNGWGELGIWSHPQDCPVPAVRRVPWITIEGHDSESYQPRDRKSKCRKSSGIEEKLTDLGYL